MVLFCKGGWFVDLNFFFFLLFRPNYFGFSLFDFSFSNGVFSSFRFFVSFVLNCCSMCVVLFFFLMCCFFLSVVVVFLSHSSRFSQINHQSHCVFSRPLSSQFRVFFLKKKEKKKSNIWWKKEQTLEGLKDANTLFLETLEKQPCKPMAIGVVEFSREGYTIRKVFA